LAANSPIEFKFELQPKQWELLNAIEGGIRHPLFGGARGGGKSFASRAIMIYRRLKYANTRGLLLRRTFKQVDGNHIQPMFYEYPFTAEWYNKSEGRVKFPNGSYLQFGHCEHEDDVHNYVGQEFEDIAVEEITQFTSNMWNLLRGSNRTTRLDIKPCMWATGNPGGIGHLFTKRLWIDRDFTQYERPDQYSYIPSRVWDNQALIDADPDYVSMLEAIEDPAIRKAWLEGDWDIFPGQFFSMWKKGKIEIDSFTIPETWAIFDGVDYAENAPTSYGRYAISPIGEVVRVWGYYQADRSGRQHAEAIRKRIDTCLFTGGRQANLVLADPSMWNRQRVDNPKGIAPVDEFRKQGIFCKKAINDRENGWRRCRDALIHEVFKTFRGHNEDFMKTVPACPRDDKNTEDIDTHSEDHCADEFRYVMMHVYKPAHRVASEEYYGTAGQIMDEVQKIGPYAAGRRQRSSAIDQLLAMN